MPTTNEIFQFIKGIDNNKTITLPKGEYKVFGDCTTPQFYYQSNNDAGERNVAFLIKDKHNVVLDFQHSTLIFQGRIAPFVFDNCNNVTLKNVVIDYDRPFYTEGEVLEADSDYYVLKIDREKFPFRVENGSFIAYGEYWEKDFSEGINMFLPFDKELKQPSYNSRLQIILTGSFARKHPHSPMAQDVFTVEDLGDGKVKFIGNNVSNAKVGDVMTITHEDRINNTVYIVNSENVTVENMEIVHSGSMGIVGQTSKDIFIKGLKCDLTDRVKGLITINCDAMHFVNCSGRVVVEDSSFFNMMDDGINVHGIYTKICEKGQDYLKLKLGHFQQFGVNVYLPGDKISVQKKGTNDKFYKLRVLSSELISEDEILIKTDDKLNKISVGDIVCNENRMPRLFVKNCKTGRNRPRGILINTPKKVVIENNEFSNSDCALFFAGDTSFWFEAGGVRDVKIRNNRFNNCCYHNSQFPIILYPEYDKNATGCYHKNVVIANNEFQIFGDGVILANSVENLVVLNNKIVKTNKFPKRIDTEVFQFTDCNDVSVLKQ